MTEETFRHLFQIESAACDAVMSAEHPSPEDGGPCATCAFRNGTEANLSPHTIVLARLCVEGFRLFHCHEHAGLCRGYVAAANLRGSKEEGRSEMYGHVSDFLADVIGFARQEQETTLKKWRE